MDFNKMEDKKETEEVKDIKETETAFENGNTVKKRRGALGFWNGKSANRLYINLGIMIFVVLVILLIVWQTPTRRFLRTLEKADKFYYQKDYDNAAKLYEKAESIIPESTKGYLGNILCKLAVGGDSVKEDYLLYAEKILNKGEILEDEKSDVTEFFLLAPVIIEDDSERIGILEKAYAMLGSEGELKTALADAYYGYALSISDKDAESLMEAYLKALEYSDDYTEILDSARDACEKYIDSLLKMDEYDKAYEILDWYSENLIRDYEGTYEKISLGKSLYDVKCELMENVIQAVLPYYDQFADSFSQENIEAMDSPLFRVLISDWEKMMELDGSENAETLAFSFASNAYIYADGGFKSGYSGVGAGLYTYGDVVTYEDGSMSQGYYFYFGEYKDGLRNGYGIMFAESGENSYVAFEGEWKDDAPNGFGVYYEKYVSELDDVDSYGKVVYGNWTLGLQDGTMTAKMSFDERPGIYFFGTYDTEYGVADELPGTPLDYGIVDEKPAGTILIAILPSTEDGDDYFVPLYVDENSTLSVWGF